MKKIILQSFLTVFFLLSVFVVNAKVRIIEQPVYEAQSTGLFEVIRIELSDKETRLHLKATFLPNWWVKFEKIDFICDSEGGEKLHPYEVINGEFDKEIYMPASGDSTFIVLYPPLGKHVKKIDYGEGENTSIWGISLEKPKKNKAKNKVAGIPAEVESWLTKEIEKSPRQQRTDFSESFFTPEGMVRLVGYIKDYDSRYELGSGMVYADNPITNEDLPIVVQVHPDGRFEADIPATYPRLFSIFFNRTVVKFYGEPGITTAMVLDWEDFLRTDRFRDRRYVFELTEFFGPVKQINEELMMVNYPHPDFRKIQNDMKSQSYTGFKKEILQKWEEARNALTTELREKEISEDVALILRTDLDVEYMYSLLHIASYKSYYAENKEEKIPDNYYDFLSLIDWNDPLSLISSHFSSFINGFEFMGPFRDISNRVIADVEQPEKNFIQYLEEDKNITFSGEDLAYKELSAKLDESNNSKESELNNLRKEFIEMNRLFYEKYRSEFMEYNEKYVAPVYAKIRGKNALREWELKDSLIQAEFHIPVALISEIPKIRSLAYLFEHSEKEQCNEVMGYVNTNIQHPFLKQEAQRMYEVYSSTNEGYELGDGIAEDAFRRIIEPYKGKYLLIDFWAIWCGPCINGIKNMKETRARLKDDADMAFLFITSEKDSPGEKYTEFVNEQELEHSFSVTDTEYNQFRQLFRFNGIPRYMLVGPDGRILNDKYQARLFVEDVKKYTGRKDL